MRLPGCIVLFLSLLDCASTLLLPSPTCSYRHDHRPDSCSLRALAHSDGLTPSHCLQLPATISSRRGWLTASGAMLVLQSNSACAADVLSDEYVFVVEDGPIGIELMDISRYLNELRVAVKRIVPGGAAEAAKMVEVNDILVSVNGRTLETSTAAQVVATISKASRPLTLVFRRPGAFRALLEPPETVSTTSALLGDGNSQDESSAVGDTVRTQLAPAAGSQSVQVASVTRTEVPELCTQGARKGDLLELIYVGYLKADPSVVFDGSAALINGKEQLGRGGDTAVSFVLGQQPAGQFPPGWDFGLVGMCVGERRKLEVPAALAYGRKGLPRRRIPPDADLVYDVKLISTNGDAQLR